MNFNKYKHYGCAIDLTGRKEVLQMTKSELKTGMVVTTKEGHKYRVYRNIATEYNNVSDKGNDVLVGSLADWLRLENYNDNLTHKLYKEYDIMKVELVNHPYDFIKDLDNVKIAETLWERQEVKELTVAEISKLLGYEVKIVK